MYPKNTKKYSENQDITENNSWNAQTSVRLFNFLSVQTFDDVVFNIMPLVQIVYFSLTWLA